MAKTFTFHYETHNEKGKPVAPSTRIFRDGVKVARVSTKMVFFYPEAIGADPLLLFDNELAAHVSQTYFEYKMKEAKDENAA